MKGKILCLAIAFLSANAFAQFMQKDTTSSGVKIDILTPVEVIKTTDKTANIKIKGVVSENHKTQILKSMKEPQIYATFDKEDDKNFKIIKNLEDDYGEIWYEVEGIYEVDKSAITNDKNALYESAKKIYEESCSACHRLHEPESFTAAQWPANIKGMVDAGFIALDESSLNLIIKFLQHNAKKSE
ncbi:hypothetical protein [Campylobacter mucosalis]|uniref:hypothetical protein n=1 Tax=Campylobacter mucosalis TaxID=202 RepID=UPI00147064CA|nr:hypothetical protein [Campylobacter mucosalis]